jgi:hypothetical protein
VPAQDGVIELGQVATDTVALVDLGASDSTEPSTPTERENSTPAKLVDVDSKDLDHPGPQKARAVVVADVNPYFTSSTPTGGGQEAAPDRKARPVDCTHIDQEEVMLTQAALAQVFPPKVMASMEEAREEHMALEDKLGWNLILSLLTIGELQFAREGELLEDSGRKFRCSQLVRTASSNTEIADSIYIILEGIFGTFIMHDGEERLLLKSTPGCLLGEDDVMMRQPRGSKLRCLSEAGRVVKMTRKQVKCVQLGNSPLVGPAESERFIDYMQEEMAHNVLTLKMAME